MVPDGANQLEKNRGFDCRDVQWQQEYAPRASHDPKEVFSKPYRRQRASFETDALLHCEPVAAFAGAFLGCLTTLHLSAFGIVPGIASALATALLCGQLLLTRATSLFPGGFFPAFYGGTFAGMTPVLWLSNNGSGDSVILAGAIFILLSIVCGFAFSIVAKIDSRSGVPLAFGYGGRSGAIATVASFLFLVLAWLFGADDRLFHGAGADLFNVELKSAALACSACMVGIFATLFVLRRERVASAKMADRTFVASAVALVGLIALHLNTPDDTRALDAFYAGCFLGMSTPERLKGWIQPVLGAVLLTAVLAQVRTFLPGVGGGLGFAAFVTVAVLVALSRATTRVTREMLMPDENSVAATQAPPTGRVYLYPPNQTRPRKRYTINGESLEAFTVGVLSRCASVIANPIPALLVIGCLVHSDMAIPDQVTPEEPDLGPTPEFIAGESPPTAAQPVLVQPGPSTVGDAIPFGTSSVDADSADAVAPNGASADLNAASPRLSGSLAGRLLAYEPASIAIHPASGAVDAADATADPWRADQAVDRPAVHLEWTDTAMRPTAEGAAPPIGETFPSGRPLDNVKESHEEIFRAFMQWEAGRSVRMAHPGRQPIKKSGNRSAQFAPSKPRQ